MWRKQILVTLVILFSDRSFAQTSFPLQPPPAIGHHFTSVDDPIYYPVDMADNPKVASSVMRGIDPIVQNTSHALSGNPSTILFATEHEPCRLN
jgi:hypothetical protein